MQINEAALSQLAQQHGRGCIRRLQSAAALSRFRCGL